MQTALWIFVAAEACVSAVLLARLMVMFGQARVVAAWMAATVLTGIVALLFPLRIKHRQRLDSRADWFRTQPKDRSDRGT
jgi:hypothetical protein